MIHVVLHRSSLPAFLEVSRLFQIRDDHPDGPLRNPHLKGDFPGRYPLMPGHKKENQCVVRKEGPLLDRFKFLTLRGADHSPPFHFLVVSGSYKKNLSNALKSENLP